MEKRVEKAANLDAEVLTRSRSAVRDTINHCRIMATVFCFNHILWHELAMVRHIPLLIEKFVLLDAIYTKPNGKSRHVDDKDSCFPATLSSSCRKEMSWMMRGDKKGYIPVLCVR
jgi:hypothetical protein